MSNMDTRGVKADRVNAVDEFRHLFKTIAKLSANERIISIQNIW
jgi:hypothetical protein